MYKIHEISEAYRRGCLRAELDGCIQPCAGVYITDGGGLGAFVLVDGEHVCIDLQASDRLLTRENEDA